MYKKYIVRLTQEQRTQLETLVRSGRTHARKLLYGRILLKADADGPDHWTDEKIAEALEGSTATVVTGAQTLLRGGVGGGVDAQEARQAQEKGPGRSSRGALGSALLFGTSRGKRTLVVEAACRSDGGAGLRG